ncbi:MAG: bifunctional 2-C-methyl-D-erythritol 4-phosphate cytidylyltransferase/2-C-methyl-D-erythritol 2,4-cyclodiphosphate synthase [Henriciella sp.]|nr:bifunctional 2-C-methyl-D-erythritol 4-phosphate cytidylyltransferase/2-C-methyl-D-erythritol 2,4-cyclodiphosphate synthase [Henriciella sp.]
MNAGAIIVAGGQGLRAGGDHPKQLQRLCGNAVFYWSAKVFLQHPSIKQLVLVVPKGDEEHYKIDGSLEMKLVHGGASRSDSVRNGLAALDLPDEAPVFIHDAARPGLTPDVIDALFEALEGVDAAAPALRVIDALKRQDGDGLTTVDRSDLYRIQTPQVFRVGPIRSALSQAGPDLVDDLAAIEATGGTIKLTAGSERLSKITYPGDLKRMEKLMSAPLPPPRVGSGYDVHAFEDGEAVILCGISIPHTQKLAGHSDADVAWHALTDALLGACALGDIGDHFPPSDPQWKGAPSELFLKHALMLVRKQGYEVSNCDITIICEAPKVKPHREQMRARTAETMGVSIDRVSVKATTTERLGFTGRQEGIAAQASVALSSVTHPA